MDKRKRSNITIDNTMCSTNNTILQFCNGLLAGKGKLLYLTVFGSHLYGTDSPKSDKDYKGIFLPDERLMLLQEKCTHLTYTSGTGNSKNTQDDIDIQLWSLQYWLDLLKKGDTNAIDLLFSLYAQHNVIIFNSNFLEKYIEHPHKLLDIKNNRAYVSYAYAQAKKYGLKGSRVGILKNIIQFFDEKICTQKNWETTKLFTISQNIQDNFFDPSLCFFKNNDLSAMLYIIGKGYDPNLKLSIMYERLKNDFEKYGNRAIQAENNQNIDWKAVSHALRCLYQIIELAQNNFLQYPLAQAEYLKAVKQGKYTWQETEQVILSLLEKADQNTISSLKIPI